jgi:hypothetical protein
MMPLKDSTTGEVQTETSETVVVIALMCMEVQTVKIDISSSGLAMVEPTKPGSSQLEEFTSQDIH